MDTKFPLPWKMIEEIRKSDKFPFREFSESHVVDANGEFVPMLNIDVMKFIVEKVNKTKILLGGIYESTRIRSN